MRPGTRAFLRESRRLPGHSLFDRIHGYVYARWPYLYIGVGTGEHALARVLGPIARWVLGIFSGGRGDEAGHTAAAFADSYHGKAVPLEQATQLVSVDEEIDLRDLEHVVPYKQARDIVLKNPDHIVGAGLPLSCVTAEPV